MLAFNMFCHQDAETATALAREPLNRYLRSLVDAASEWRKGAFSADYPEYGRIIEGLAGETFGSQVAKGAAWVGTSGELAERIEDYRSMVGGFDIASMQVNFNTIPVETAEASMRLFAAEVMPRFRD